MTDDPTPFDRLRSPRARRADAEAAVEEIRQAMAAEISGRVAWMKRHAGLLGLDIPVDAPGTRETERLFMPIAAQALRALEAGEDAGAVATARAELDALTLGERENFARIMERHGDVLES